MSIETRIIKTKSKFKSLVEPSFQGVNRLFKLVFENDAERRSNKRLSSECRIKNYNFMTNGKNFFDQPVKNNKVTYENITKIATGQGDNYATGCLLDNIYFKKLLQNDCSRFKQTASSRCYPKAIQQINFTANLDRAGDTRIYFILEEAKETVLDF